MSLSQKTQGILMQQNWGLQQTLVKMQGSTNLATSHPTFENILKTGNLANANEIIKSLSSISDYGKNKQESQIMRQ